MSDTLKDILLILAPPRGALGSLPAALGEKRLHGRLDLRYELQHLASSILTVAHLDGGTYVLQLVEFCHRLNSLNWSPHDPSNQGRRGGVPRMELHASLDDLFITQVQGALEELHTCVREKLEPPGGSAGAVDYLTMAAWELLSSVGARRHT